MWICFLSTWLLWPPPNTHILLFPSLFRKVPLQDEKGMYGNVKSSSSNNFTRTRFLHQSIFSLIFYSYLKMFRMHFHEILKRNFIHSEFFKNCLQKNIEFLMPLGVLHSVWSSTKVLNELFSSSHSKWWKLCKLREELPRRCKINNNRASRKKTSSFSLSFQMRCVTIEWMR